MSLTDFFRPWRDSYGAHAFEVLEYFMYMGIILWVQTGVNTGTSEYGIVDFTFKLGMVGLMLKLVDFTMWSISPKKADTSMIQTLGFGTGWRALWGGVSGLMLVFALNVGTAGKLSFFSTSLQFNTTYLFWFLVFIGPRIEELFSNTLMPLFTNVVRIIWPQMSYLLAGTIVLLLIVAPAFMLFHYFTYFSKVGTDTGILIIMMFAAYVFRVLFTVGNYFFKTDELGKWAHSLHNLIAYWITIDNPLKILPQWQVFGIVAGFALIGLYFSAYTIYRIGKFGIPGLKPDTVLDDL